MCIHCDLVKSAINTVGSFISKEHGDTVSFTCTADGYPRPKVIWRFNGQPLLANTSRYMITYTYGEYGFRSIPNVQQISVHLNISDLSEVADNGLYSCRADNEAKIHSVMEVPFTLTVNGQRIYNYNCTTNYLQII